MFKGLDREPLHTCSGEADGSSGIDPRCRVESDDLDHRKVLVSGEVELWEHLGITDGHRSNF